MLRWRELLVLFRLVDLTKNCKLIHLCYSYPKKYFLFGYEIDIFIQTQLRAYQKKSCDIPLQSKIQFGDFYHLNFILKSCQIYFFIYILIFLYFISCFISKSSLSRIVGIFWQAKNNIFIRDNFFLWFFFFNDPFKLSYQAITTH